MRQHPEPVNYVLRGRDGRAVAYALDGMLVRLSRTADLSGSWRDLRRAFTVEPYGDAEAVRSVVRTEAVLWEWDTSAAGRADADRKRVQALLDWKAPEP